MKLFLLIGGGLLVAGFLFLCFLLVGGFDMLRASWEVSRRGEHADTPMVLGPVAAKLPRGFRVPQNVLHQVTTAYATYEATLGNYYEVGGQRISGIALITVAAPGKEKELVPTASDGEWRVEKIEGNVARAVFTGSGLRGHLHVDTGMGVKVELRAKGDVYAPNQTMALAEEIAKSVVVDRAAVAKVFAAADEEAQMRKIRPGQVWAWLEKRFGTAMPVDDQAVAVSKDEVLVFNSAERDSATVWSKLGEETGAAAGIAEDEVVTKKTILQPHVANGLMVSAVVDGELKMWDVKVGAGPFASNMPNWPEAAKTALERLTPVGKVAVWRHGWTERFSTQGVEPVKAWFDDVDRMRASAGRGEKAWKRLTQ